ncbi:reverse transcriptase domain, reverse transcriptase zinc-binding domain protein [Tanacetum coccineum]
MLITRSSATNATNVYDIIHNLLPFVKRRTTRSMIAKLVVAATAYYVWQERNWRLFKKGKRSSDQIVERILSTIQLKLLSCKLKKSKSGESLARLWDLPEAVSKVCGRVILYLHIYLLVMEILTLILLRRVRNSNDFHSVVVIIDALEEFKQVLGALPVRYLGVPLISSRLLYRDCKILVEKLKSRVNDWRNKFLSFDGRLQLIWLVLSSMHIYWAFIFILPNRIVHDLEQLMRGFLWCQGEIKKGKAKVAWDSVCMPKHEGGLGILLDRVFLLMTQSINLSPMVVGDGLLTDYLGMVFCGLSQWPVLEIRFRLWLILLIGKLKTQDRLRQWDVGLSIDLNLLRFPLCDLVPDSHDHLFFECAFSLQVWFKVRVLCGMDSIPPWLVDVTTFINPIYKGKTAVSILSRLVFAAKSYYIWLERNGRLFKEEDFVSRSDC